MSLSLLECKVENHKIKPRYMTKEECREALRKNKRVTSVSALINVAIEDAGKLDQSKYMADSRVFHRYWDKDNYCHVCTAGFVIAGTLNGKLNLMLNPQYYGPNTYRALMALDSIRTGAYHLALAHLGLKYPTTLIRKRIYLIRFSSFTNWAQANVHLESLRLIADVFKEYELGEVSILDKIKDIAQLAKV